jgi:hypothetical protein
MMSDERLRALKQIARRDDWHQHLVGSDIRLMIGEIERLKRQEQFLSEIVKSYRDMVNQMTQRSESGLK